jgi:hypothetical protein
MSDFLIVDPRWQRSRFEKLTFAQQEVRYPEVVKLRSLLDPVPQKVSLICEMSTQRFSAQHLCHAASLQSSVSTSRTVVLLSRDKDRLRDDGPGGVEGYREEAGGISSVQRQSALERFLDPTIRIAIAVGRTNDLLHYLMVLLIHDLKFARPKRSEFFDPGLGGM